MKGRIYFFSLWPHATLSDCELAFASQINNLVTGHCYDCVHGTPISRHTATVVSYSTKVELKAPTGQRKLTWIYIITCLKWIECGEQSAASATLTLVKALVNKVTTCLSLVWLTICCYFILISGLFKYFQLETWSLRHMCTIVEMLVHVFSGQWNIFGITIQPWVAGVYKTGARYIEMVKMMTIFHSFSTVWPFG